MADRLALLRPLRAVYGNIDGQPLRELFPVDQRFILENVTVWMRHIGGYPGHYEKTVSDLLREDPPKLFITGHSHILKVQYDRRFKLLHINPGAAGKYGFHTVQTMVKFILDTGRILDLEVVELDKK